MHINDADAAKPHIFHTYIHNIKPHFRWKDRKSFENWIWVNLNACFDITFAIASNSTFTCSVFCMKQQQPKRSIHIMRHYRLSRIGFSWLLLEIFTCDEMSWRKSWMCSKTWYCDNIDSITWLRYDSSRSVMYNKYICMYM